MNEMPKMTKIKAGKFCRFTYCRYNQLPPIKGSQECIGCEGLLKKGGAS